MFPTITLGGRFNLILEESPFSSWDLELGEVGVSAKPPTTLGVLGVLVDAGS